MMSFCRRICILPLVVACSLALPAQSSSPFVGKWVFNVEKCRREAILFPSILLFAGNRTPYLAHGGASRCECTGFLPNRYDKRPLKISGGR